MNAFANKPITQSKMQRLLEKITPLRWKVFPHHFVSNSSPIIVGGCARSGTTMLRMMLDSHSRICCGPETLVFSGKRIKVRSLAMKCEIPVREVTQLLWESRSRPEFIDRFFTQYCAAQNKQRWAEKTPKNIRHIETVFRHFPHARVVHVLRDGRDVVCSLRTHPCNRLENGVLVPNDIRRPIEYCARKWRMEVEKGLAWRGHARYYEVRYEDLVTRTEETLRALFQWLEEPWDANVMRYYEIRSGSRQPELNVGNPNMNRPVSPRSIGRWKRDLNEEEQATMKREAGELLEKLGYVW